MKPSNSVISKLKAYIDNVKPNSRQNKGSKPISRNGEQLRGGRTSRDSDQ